MPPLYAQQKNCVQCKNTFQKRVTCSKREWETVRFCSKKCYNESKRGKKMPWLERHNFTKGQKAWNKGLPGRTGTDNPTWKEKPSYMTIHKWLQSKAKKRGHCQNCKRTGKTHWANISGVYTRNIEDYRELCPGCHLKLDRYGFHLSYETIEESPKEWQKSNP